MMEPKIRLKGFKGEWEENTISQTAPLQRGFDLPTHCVVEGDVPIAYSNGILRYHNQGKCIAPAVVTGRSGTIGKFTYIESGKYWPHNTSLWVTNFFGNNPLFVYYLFHTKHFENYASGSGVPTLNRNDIHALKVNIPQLAEQQAIASYFTSLDSQISTSASRLASLKQVKTASLQAMFPQEGETVPRIRFKGFEGDWEKVKLNSFAKRVTRKNSHLESTLALTIASAIGLVSQIEYFNNLVVGSNINNYYLLKKGEFAYNKSYSSGYPFGSVKRLDRYEQGILSTLYIVFSIDDTISSDYLTHFFDTNLWHKEVAERAAEGARNHGLLNIGAEDFFDINIWKPKKQEEQQKIADYFTNLDKQITLQAQRLEKLKQIKAACLDKMFV